MRSSLVCAFLIGLSHLTVAQDISSPHGPTDIRNVANELTPIRAPLEGVVAAESAAEGVHLEARKGSKVKPKKKTSKKVKTSAKKTSAKKTSAVKTTAKKTSKVVKTTAKKTTVVKTSAPTKKTSVAKTTTKKATKTASGLTTKVTKATTTTDGDSCPLNFNTKNGKRAPTPAKGCKPDPTLDPLHVTEITKSIAVLKTYTETCSVAKAGQACYHYYSVIENNKAKGWDKFTCTDGQDRHDGTATAVWERQHPKNAWRDYLPKAMTNAKGIVSCQRDEYPPGYFNKKGGAQIIRWLPQKDNDAGGKVWAAFCSKNDGGKGNGQLLEQNKAKNIAKGTVNDKLVDLGKAGNEKVKKPNPQAKATTTTQFEAKFTRAVFSMEFDWGAKGKPDKGNDWFLSENPCWPKAIATDDPGYNLFTDDPWYATAGTPQQQAARMAQKALYAAAPPKAYTDKAVKPKKRGAAFLHEREFEILEDGYGVRSGNMSRRLDDGEFEVIQCDTKDCANERRMLAEEEIAAVIPAPEEIRAAMPVDSEVVPTAAPESKFIVREVEQREAASPELPAATGGW